MIRRTLTDTQGAVIAPYGPGRGCDPGRTGPDPRLFAEAALRIGRTGCRWRDLPEVSGMWNTVFKRVRRWVKANAFYRMFRALSENADLDQAMIDCRNVTVLGHAQGAKGGSRPGYRVLSRR